MAASGRVIGTLLIGFGVLIGVGFVAWLYFGSQENNLEGSGAALGLIVCFGTVVLPLIGGGIYFLLRGQSEARDLAEVEAQRRLLDIVSTRGQVSITDIVLETKSTRDAVQSDLYELVGKGLFSGYVDWRKGMLYSVDASKLQGQTHCPNCGGELELAGKGLIRCPYCGAEIFLQG